MVSFQVSTLLSHSALTRWPRDTVSSICIIHRRSLPFTDSVEHVCFIRHALALDERRVKFLPEYFAPSAGSQEPLTNFPKVKEVWFPGTHSDMWIRSSSFIDHSYCAITRGGGNRVNTNLKSGKTASLWISLEAISCGLNLKLNKDDWDWARLDDIQESLTSGWRILEYLPIKRETHTRVKKKQRAGTQFIRNPRDSLLIHSPKLAYGQRAKYALWTANTCFGCFLPTSLWT